MGQAPPHDVGLDAKPEQLGGLGVAEHVGRHPDASAAPQTGEEGVDAGVLMACRRRPPQRRSVTAVDSGEVDSPQHFSGPDTPCAVLAEDMLLTVS